MFGFVAIDRHRRFEKYAELLLDAALTALASEIERTRDLDDERCCENRIATQKIDLDLHLLPEETGNVDIVPGFFVIAAGLIVIDLDDVIVDGITEDRIEYRGLRRELRCERGRIVESFTIAIAEDVCRKPAIDVKRARFERRRDDGLEHRLPRLAIFSRNGDVASIREFDEGRNVGGETRREIAVGDARIDRGVCVQHRGRDLGVVRIECVFESFETQEFRCGEVGPTLDRREINDDASIGVTRRTEARDIALNLRDRRAVACRGERVRARHVIAPAGSPNGGHRRERGKCGRDGG